MENHSKDRSLNPLHCPLVEVSSNAHKYGWSIAVADIKGGHVIDVLALDDALQSYNPDGCEKQRVW